MHHYYFILIISYGYKICSVLLHYTSSVGKLIDTGFPDGCIFFLHGDNGTVLIITGRSTYFLNKMFKLSCGSLLIEELATLLLELVPAR